MPLSAGTRLGPYEIAAPIGAGGMGEVYRARDTRLDRTVAIKVLRGHISDRVDLRQRFEREARAISSLSHPNICVLHDVGHEGDTDFLVMEHLEGQALSERLAKGPLSREEALRYAIQIAAGLDCAHRQGIVHRDLKPGNIILTRHGAKLLDFGLARVAEAAPPVDVAEAATRTQLTSQGTILGTVQYMAPEQLEGKTADARSDVFSFGAVLYEMITGRAAFEGKSAASLIAAIMHSDPPPLSPADSKSAADPLERVVRKCLSKEPDRRWQTAADLRDELEWIVEAPAAPVARATPRRTLAWIGGAAALCVMAIAAILLFGKRETAPQRAAIRFVIRPPENTWWVQGVTNQSFAISPEGGQLAFIGKTLDQTQIWIRPLGSLTAHPLPGTEDVFTLFWAPDSRSILFWANRKLKKIAIAGGPPQVLADVRDPLWRGVTLPNGDLIANASLLTYRFAASGNLSTIPNKIFLWPEILPDGDHLLYRHRLSQTVFMDSLRSGATTSLFQADSRVEYAPPTEAGQPGYLLYIKGNTLTAHPFDANRQRLEGEPVIVDEGVPYFQPTSAAEFSVSHDGNLVYRQGEQRTHLTWVDRNGKEIQALDIPGEAWNRLRLSPDGQKLAVSIRTPAAGGSDIWIYELRRKLSTRLTFDPGVEAQPVWSPDGKRVIFASAQASAPKLWWKTVGETGSGQAISGGRFEIPTDWSQDGRYVFYQTSGTDTDSDIWVLPFDKDGRPGRGSLLIHTEFSNNEATLSPDGKWIAFVSDETGRLEIFVQAFHGEGTPSVSGERLRVSKDGGTLPRWRADGKELFFIARDNRLMAAPVKAGTGFQTGDPVALFRLREPLPLLTAQAPGFDVSADGQRFLVATTDASERPPLIEVVNWQAGLRH